MRSWVFVERAGEFLAIAGYERQGGAAVEQLDRRLDLGGANAQFLCDLAFQCRGHVARPYDPSRCSVLARIRSSVGRRRRDP